MTVARIESNTPTGHQSITPKMDVILSLGFDPEYIRRLSFMQASQSEKSALPYLSDRTETHAIIMTVEISSDKTEPTEKVGCIAITASHGALAFSYSKNIQDAFLTAIQQTVAVEQGYFPCTCSTASLRAAPNLLSRRRFSVDSGEQSILLEDSLIQKEKEEVRSSSTITTGYLRGMPPDLKRKVEYLARLQDNWDEHGAEAPNQAAVSAAIKVLELLSMVQLLPNHIDPSTDGGICISFEVEGKYADIECFNTGEILAALAKRGTRKVDVWSVDKQEDSIRRAILLIRDYITN